MAQAMLQSSASSRASQHNLITTHVACAPQGQSHDQGHHLYDTNIISCCCELVPAYNLYAHHLMRHDYAESL